MDTDGWTVFGNHAALAFECLGYDQTARLASLYPWPPQ
jgi:hypothetical protein